LADREEKELERLRNAVAELSSLNQISSAINSSMSVEKISSIIVDKCLKHTNASQGVIFLIDNSDGGQNPEKFKTFVRQMFDSRDNIPFHMHMSLAGWMIKNKQLLIINSPQEKHPLHGLDFDKLGVSSVLAAPLLAQHGLIGVLALFNKRGDGGFTSIDKRFLGIVGTQCAQVVEGARLYAQEQTLIALRGELEIARQIQQGFLPKRSSMPDSNDCFGVNIPAKEIGGDFFDIVPCGENEIFISIGDVVGKGVPAALLMANAQAVLRSQLRQGQSMDFSFLAGNLNHLVCEFTSPGQFITGLFGSYNKKSRLFNYISAGHPLPIIAQKERIIKSPVDSDIVFGVLPDYKFTQHTLELPEKSVMLLYTDGLSEAENETKNQFGEHRTEQLLCELADMPAKDICDRIIKIVSEFAGRAPQSDDLTLVVVKSK
jgi:sigma-B regulation protein RsbU (phosphoserine phosphatase)